ncbi:hemagglutinin repeat-containing protein [Psychrobacter jeotgali]|uniref:hemagglutinin repeat-containing protein n=1 Tax=Psychrobacter jeotgali TaxID=179010 RepID=UPI00191B2452|nr:hemagglutinin repeat-containing protein [Psychrobacter jeotgali]
MGEDTDKAISDPNRGNAIIRAQDINIDNALDIETNQSEQKSKTSGLTVSVSNSLIDSAKAIDNLVDAGGNTDSTRMKGMAAVSGLLKARAITKQTGDAISGVSTLGNTRIQATIGSQKSQSNSSSYTEVNQGSNINTNNLALIATGAGKDSNININGSNINVNNNALFQADNDFNVSGVAQNSNTRSTNSSSSAAIGGYASFGGQGPSGGITANASKGKGYANSDSVTYANSQINVGGTSTFDIGNDVNIKGGVIDTNKAQGTIGGNVNIESLQDTAVYDSNQKNVGFTLDVDLVNNGAGSSLSLNGGKTNINADYKAVGQQSGIFTGDGGFDLEVEGKTNLIGGAITTTDKALELGLNKYVSKGGIVTQDIENSSSYEGDAISVGVSLGNTTGKPQATMNGLGYGTDGDSDSSITKAGITGIAGNSGITTDNREEYAGALVNAFDEIRVSEEVGAQTQITREFGKEAPKAVGDFAASRQLDLIEQGRIDEADKWAEGGAYRVGLHTLVGAIATGSVDGALASGTTAVSIPAVGRYLDEQGVDETTKNALLLGLSAGIGSAVGGDTAGAASSVNQTQNNYLNHIQLQNWVDGLKACNGNSTCVTRVNDIYQKLDKDQQNRLNNVCNDNFNLAQCKAEIINYNSAYPSANVAEPLYKQINKLGGGSNTSFNTRNNNGYAIQARDRGISNIARAEGKTAQAIAGEIWYVSSYGGGRGGSAVSAKAPATKVTTNSKNNSFPNTTNATNINAQAALKAKLSALQTAQNTAIKTKVLPDGRVRYYAQEKLASKPGSTRGASFVTEHNPKTGFVRQWMESYNHKGEVIRVNPKSINGQQVTGQHYPPTGKELGR